ncbi:hypothetical protein AOZ06_47380 [Kibdelosporangium phytohabitans]|uniref:Uncharacterized protein n=1 Tax=Kibdelosporangium phytohabitans TaxID=860235 RepID=A0A0N9I0Y6_9PSEU|nr:hypothetical protein AOZ06_47380 [Kibdelosporangium phytohabitans]
MPDGYHSAILQRGLEPDRGHLEVPTRVLRSGVGQEHLVQPGTGAAPADEAGRAQRVELVHDRALAADVTCAMPRLPAVSGEQDLVLTGPGERTSPLAPPYLLHRRAGSIRVKPPTGARWLLNANAQSSPMAAFACGVETVIPSITMIETRIYLSRMTQLLIIGP